MVKKSLLINILLAVFILFIKIDHAQSLTTMSSKLSHSAIKASKEKENLISREQWQFMRLRDPKSNRIPNNISTLEREFAKTLPNDKMVKLRKANKVFDTQQWTYRGPFNQGGRSRAIAVDVANPNIILAGGATGGMWRSTDNGQNWTRVTPVQDTIQTVTCIVQDTRAGKTNTWYYGTGEYASNLILPNNNAGFATLLGAGIYKSTDDGVTWTRLISTMPSYSPTFVNLFQIVWNIAIDTSNNSQDIVYAAVFGSIYRSSDGGASWNQVLGTNNVSTYTNVAVTSKGDVYAALSNGTTQGIWHSVNGINWSDITPANFPTVYARIVIANAPTNSNVLYVLANTPNSGMPGDPQNGTDDYQSLWKYDASASQWTDLTNNLPSWSGNVGGYSSQGSYDMLIKVNPSDSNFVIIGGTNLYRTTDGFATKLDSTDWIGGYSTANDISSYPNQHPDEHDLYFLPSNPKVVYSANDGGVSYTTDVTAQQVNWTSIDEGFTTTQFRSVALDHATANSPLIVGGMQDNGNMMDTSWNKNSNWVTLPAGGDGCIDAVADGGSYIYFSTQNGSIIEGRISDNNGALIKPAGASGFMFITPYVLDPTNTSIMYLAAGTQIWRNSNLLNIPLGGDSATTIGWTQMINIDTTSTISALAVSTSPAHILYYGTTDGTVFKVVGADLGVPVSINITSNNFPTGGYVSSIAVDPSNADNVIVDFSNYSVQSIFYSTDGGTSWTAVSGNLEQNADGTGNGPSVRSVRILDLNGSKIYYAGTSTGLYATTSLNGMSTEWIQQAAASIGMVDAEAIDTRNNDGTVAVGTFGAGVFSTKVLATGVNEQKNVPLSYSLSQNYPNPFNPSTKIKYSVAKSELVKLTVYNILGQQVSTLVDKVQPAGNYEINFDASKLSSGVYLYRLDAGNFTNVKKMILIK